MCFVAAVGAWASVLCQCFRLIGIPKAGSVLHVIIHFQVFPVGLGRHLWDIRVMTLLNDRNVRVRLTRLSIFLDCALISNRNCRLMVLSFRLPCSVRKPPFCFCIFASFILIARFDMAFGEGSFFRRFTTQPQLASALALCVNVLAYHNGRIRTVRGLGKKYR